MYPKRTRDGWACEEEEGACAVRGTSVAGMRLGHPLEAARSNNKSIFKLIHAMQLVTAAVGILRVCIVFLQVWSRIHHEYLRDESFVQLCASGSANESPKMQQACMDVAVDRSSPVVAKAVLETFKQLSVELFELASSPIQSMGILGYVAVVFGAPVLRFLGPIFALLVAQWRSHSASARSEHGQAGAGDVILVTFGQGANESAFTNTHSKSPHSNRLKWD